MRLTLEREDGRRVTAELGTKWLIPPREEQDIHIGINAEVKLMDEMEDGINKQLAEKRLIRLLLACLHTGQTLEEFERIVGLVPA